MPTTLTLSGTDGSSRPVVLPTSWLDITVGQLLRLTTEPNTPRLCILSDMTPEELARIDPPDLLYFANCLEFMTDRESLAELLTFFLPFAHGR
ncbi:hypothetical protein MON38_10635 [Hymenobacter sp. DH14]|uniref:Uncharacterized protein n=1 Tax=Hymenobacter cyanobacteriorum TaxID=2926463 RepID=A0A9X1VGQ3_9BACT|nr:hypothetical protein [Hymenobacter cyanobacteriorum]MCI1187877.1 hypothetical protein [Hymenobacter cyanobacteriorum]